MILIEVEGVLRSPTGQTITEGMALYRGLCSTGRVGLVLDSLSVAKADHWLKVEGMRSHVELIEADLRYMGVELRRYQMDRARSRDSWVVLIDSQPDNIAAALEMGITGLLFTKPAYLRPEFRPDFDKTVKPWAEIQEELQHQEDIIALDPRLNSPQVAEEFRPL